MKFLKWFLTFLIILITLLLILFYISSLFSYKKEDFNIPDGFFDSKFSYKDTESNQNGFKELVNFIDSIDNKGVELLNYFDVLGKCTFKDSYYMSGTIFLEEKCNNDLENNFNEFISEYDKKLKDISKRYIKLSDLETNILNDFYSNISIEKSDKNIDFLSKDITSLKPSDLEYYKTFDYISNSKKLNRYNDTIDKLSKNNFEISNLGDLVEFIDKVNYGLVNDENLISELEIEIGKLFKGRITLEDFKIYRDGIIYIEKNKNRIIDKEIRNLRNFIFISNKKNEKFNEYEFIKYTDEYISKKSKQVSYSNLIKYYRINRLISNYYFEKGNYDKGVELLLRQQEFIDFLIKKSDLDLITSLSFLTIDRINIEFIKYSIDNYELPDKEKELIKKYFFYNSDIEIGLISNSLKVQHYINKPLLDKINFSNGNVLGIIIKSDGSKYVEYDSFFQHIILFIKYKLLFSLSETKLLADKIMYDTINNKGNSSDFSCKINLNNYIGRSLFCHGNLTLYSNQYQKEQDLIDLRQIILDSLK